MVMLESPDIIVGTPARILSHLKDRVRTNLALSLSLHLSLLLPYPPLPFQTLHLKNSLELLVVDEADLLFSFGYEEDLKSLMR